MKFKTVFIFLLFFFLLIFIRDVSASDCGCQQNIPGCSNNNQCGVSLFGNRETWSCMIMENDCGCTSCGGFTPCCYTKTGQGTQVDSCSGFDGTRYASCKTQGCPNIKWPNGGDCELIDSCWGNGVPHCRGYNGTWDASQKMCVKCNGVKQEKVIAKTNEKCFEIHDGGDCISSPFQWTELSCANEGANTCEYACGADADCDEIYPDTTWSDGNVIKKCNSSCKYSWESCGPNAREVEREDFIMGANTQVTMSGESDKIRILKNNGFTWVRLIFNESDYTNNGQCPDYDGNGRRDIIDCFVGSEFLARQEVRWNFNYSILLGFDQNYTGRENDLKALANKVVTDIRNPNNYPSWFSTHPGPFIGIYEIGGELDYGAFAGASPGDWTKQAPLLKKAIEGVKEADPNAKIKLHLANSHRPELVETFLSEMDSRGVDFDYLGFTVYHTAYGDNNLLSQSIDKANEYGKKVILSELGGYPSNDCDDWVEPPWSLNKFDDYSFDENGQADYIKDELNFLDSKSNVLGVFYVGPVEPINFFCVEDKDCALNLGDVDGDGQDDYYCWSGSLIRPDGTLKPAIKEIKFFMGGKCKTSCTSDYDCAEGYRCYSPLSACWICNGNNICENVTNSKPSLEEINITRKKYPNAMIGVDSDMVYDMIKKGVVWKDTYTGKQYSNAYELFRDKGVNWVRVMLFWNETQGLYNLDYINKSLHLAKDAGFNIVVVLSFSDDWRDEGPHCINFNNITVHSRYDPTAPCKKFKDLDDANKKAIMKEYAGNVSKFFEREGIDVKVYEIGSEIGIPGFFSPIPELSPCSEDEIRWYRDNIWNQEADVIKDIIPELNKSNPDVLIQSHVDDGFQCREFVFEYYKTMLNKGVDLDIATISYYPSFINKGYLFQEVHQNFGYLLSEIDWVRQQLLNKGYDIKFMISEFGYPSSHDLNEFFKGADYEIQSFHWDDYSGTENIYDWLKLDYCPKCNATPGYGFSPTEHARWLRDFYDAINSDNNITGSFLFSPESVDLSWNNFGSLFDIIPETYDVCPDCCDSDGTATHDSICHAECGADPNCNTRSPNSIWFDGVWKSCDFYCKYSEKYFKEVIPESENIIVSMNAKNTGTETQTDWKVETELWKNLASGEKVSPMKASYDALTGSQCDIADCGCDLIGNTVWNSGENNNITCHIPSSHWGTTGENDRIMFWVGAKINGIDKYLYREVPDIAIIVTTVPTSGTALSMTTVPTTTLHVTTTPLETTTTPAWQYVQLELIANTAIILVALVVIIVIIFVGFKFFARK